MDVRKTFVPVAGVDQRAFLPAGQLPGENQPPLPMGKAAMTPYVRDQLSLLGWKDGDPIPGDFGLYVDKARAEHEAERKAAGKDIASKAINPRRVEVTDIRDLPADKQGELAKLLADFKGAMAAQNAQAATDAKNANLPPDIAKGLQGMAAAAAQSQAPPPATPSPAEPAPADAGETPAPVRSHCPRCQFDLRLDHKVDISPEDAKAFVIALRTATSFRKTYDLIPDQLSVTFRDLTAREQVEINKQLGYDIKAGGIANDAEYMMSLLNYRRVLAACRIVAGTTIQCEPPSLAQYRTTLGETRYEFEKEGEKTLLPKMMEEFYDKYATTETFQRMLSQVHVEFQRLVETLEVKIRDRDFCKGIGLFA